MKPLNSHSFNTIAYSARSLYSVSATVLLASVTHAYDFGLPALVVGVVVVGALYLLRRRFLYTGGWGAFTIYGLLNLWIIAGFGLVGGLWNHTVKMALIQHGGIPAGLEGLFMRPEAGSVLFEGSGMLTSLTCLIAAYFGYWFVRAALASDTASAADGRSPDTPLNEGASPW